MRIRTIAIVLMLACGAGVVHAEVIDRVLAVVAGDLITLSDVTAARDLGFVRPPDTGDPVRAVLSSLIDRALVLAEVDRYAPPEPSAEAVDRGVAEVRARFASDQTLDAALARSGLDASKLRGIVRQNLRIQAYEEQRFTAAAPTEAELGRYYREHADQFTRGEALAPYNEVKDQIAATMAVERRQALVDDWIAGLRRRADILDVYLTGK
jgi:hypothetical protein